MWVGCDRALLTRSTTQVGKACWTSRVAWVSIHHIFDGLVFSAAEGINKPISWIYQRLTKQPTAFFVIIETQPQLLPDVQQLARGVFG